MQRELLPWTEIDPLIDHLVSQIDREIDVLLTLNPGGIVPGGILAEAPIIIQRRIFWQIR